MAIPGRDGVSIVIGATGGIGSALAERLSAGGGRVLPLARSTDPAIDLLDEASIAAAATTIGERLGRDGIDVRLIFDATGVLRDPAAALEPEKSWRRMTPEGLARAFAINAIGPALLMKHFLPLLPRSGRSVFATLSAKVGGIGDNRLGGWYGYRASKAALNQLVKTAAIELARRHPEAICVALHPGTVDTGLSRPFAKDGLDVHPPAVAAERLLAVIAGLDARDSGGFFDHRGCALPW